MSTAASVGRGASSSLEARDFGCAALAATCSTNSLHQFLHFFTPFAEMLPAMQWRWAQEHNRGMGANV